MEEFIKNFALPGTTIVNTIGIGIALTVGHWLGKMLVGVAVQVLSSLQSAGARVATKR